MYIVLQYYEGSTWLFCHYTAVPDAIQGHFCRRFPLHWACRANVPWRATKRCHPWMEKDVLRNCWTWWVRQTWLDNVGYHGLDSLWECLSLFIKWLKEATQRIFHGNYLRSGNLWWLVASVGHAISSVSWLRSRGWSPRPASTGSTKLAMCGEDMGRCTWLQLAGFMVYGPLVKR